MTPGIHVCVAERARVRCRAPWQGWGARIATLALALGAALAALVVGRAALLDARACDLRLPPERVIAAPFDAAIAYELAPPILR
jgi:hypothetical protein